MPYSNCGLIVLRQEELKCAESNWPFATLAEQVSLIPLERDYVFLSNGDLTEAAEIHGWVSPQWLSQMVSRFSKAAYIEAEFWGGTGMQASVMWEAGQLTFGPEVSTGAINAALRRMGIADGPAVTIRGLPLASGRDPFDVVGLGRHRSVSSWLQEIAEQGRCTERGRATSVSSSDVRGRPRR